MINEGLVNEEYYRQQVVLLGKQVALDSATKVRMLRTINELSSSFDDCMVALNEAEYVTVYNNETIDLQQKQNKKLQRKNWWLKVWGYGSTVVAVALAVVVLVLK